MLDKAMECALKNGDADAAAEIIGARTLFKWVRMLAMENPRRLRVRIERLEFGLTEMHKKTLETAAERMLFYGYPLIAAKLRGMARAAGPMETAVTETVLLEKIFRAMADGAAEPEIPDSKGAWKKIEKSGPKHKTTKDAATGER